MKKCRVLLYIGCRSDEGLSAPILKRLENDDFFESHIQTLYPGHFKTTYELVDNFMENDFDLAICVADRLEMFAAAMATFVNNIPIAHIYAGIIDSEHPTKDEIFRHNISLLSDIQFVESKKAMLNLEMLFMAVKKTSNCHIVGITHLDDLEIDESLVPKKPYNLILYNPLTNPEKVLEMGWEIARIKAIAGIGLNKNIVIGSNPDQWKSDYPDLSKLIKNNTVFYKNLPRKQFLGLLKNCRSLIGNSSSEIYEAPYFLKEDQIINIGIRNADRTPVDITKTGASDKIIEIIKEWWVKKNEGNNTIS